ncbi:hypothetical protein V8F33_008460 [Rhypophila sp. PSN 637]
MPPPLTPGAAPGPDESIIGSMLGPLIPIHILSTFLVGMRLYTRARPVNATPMGRRGYYVATSLQFGILLYVIPYGLGRHNFYISAQDQFQPSKLLFISQILSCWAIVLGKIAIALLLLRLKTGTRWHIFLYAMCAVQVCYAIVATVVSLARCKPISAAWDYKTEIRDCWPAHVVTLAICINGSIAITSDVVLALIPFTFLGSIRRSLRERLVIAFLLGLGLFTAGAVGVKFVFARKYGQTGNLLWHCIGLVTWSALEAEMGVYCRLYAVS